MLGSRGSISLEWSSPLSPRECEVALMVARGLANKDIALELGLSEGTVKQHVHHIFLKLGMRRRNLLTCLVSGGAVAYRDKETVAN